MLQTHYRSSLDFSDSRLEEAKVATRVLEPAAQSAVGAISQVRDGVATGAIDGLTSAVAAAREKFTAEMDDDFNTAAALAAVFELAKAANTFLAQYQLDLCEDDRRVLCDAEDVVVDLLGVLGIETDEEEKAVYPPAVFELAKDVAGYEGTDAQEAVDALLKTRSVARAEKNWELADVVRGGLTRIGFQIEDTPQGARVLYEHRRSATLVIEGRNAIVEATGRHAHQTITTADGVVDRVLDEIADGQASSASTSRRPQTRTGRQERARRAPRRARRGGAYACVSATC
jgi:cysteinyl-tRNA synthetase